MDPALAPSRAAGADWQKEPECRETLTRLGRSGKPWDFLPSGTRAIEHDPTDFELTFLVAANFARLHLRTAAADLIAGLPEHVRREPGVATLAEMIDNLPCDEITASSRSSMCAANLEALALRGIDLSEHHREWLQRVHDDQYLRALDGNVVKRCVSGPRPGPWLGLGDRRAEARVAAQRVLTDEGSQGSPHTISGVDPPWTFQCVCEALKPGSDGHEARVNVLQRDALAALDGLSIVDLSGELCRARVHVYVGDRAVESLGRDLRDRLHTGIKGPIISQDGPGSRLAVSIEQLFNALEREQATEQAALASEVQRAYAPRDRAWWERRFREAREGTGPRLRVLVPTCRYSTFVKHSSADAAAALEEAGCEVRVLVEPDETCHLNGLAYLRPIARWQPDLVLLINYTRATLRGMFGPIIPLQLPFVCWIQDAMPHLFRDGAGAQHGKFDFIIGHQHKELFERFGYARERTMACSVVASERKFHPRPVESSLRRRHECEMAYVSRHAETVEAMHARLCREAGHDAALVRVLEHLYPRVRAIGENPLAHFAHSAFDEITSEALLATRYPGPQPDPRLVTLIAKQYCGPIAERAVRHQSLHWAADIAEKNGWRLNLYGHGWESHPRFARFAKGELDHGEQLRASYQWAATHLHATVHFLMHQRVVECVLSGGFPMIRLNSDEVSTLFWAGVGALFARGAQADFADPLSGINAFTVSDHAELCRVVGLRQRLGLPAESAVPYTAKQRERFAKRGAVAKPEEQAIWLLADSAESFFSTPADLESNVRQAIERPELRRGIAQFAAARIRPRLTYAALVREVIALVQNSFSPQTQGKVA